MSKKILWLDLETTGLDEHLHGIISLAMLAEIDGVLVDELYVEMFPTGRDGDIKALEINGYTIEQVKSFRPWERVKVDVDMFLQTHIDKWSKTDKFILAGQNVKDFDLKFLKSYYEACGDNYIFSYIKAGPYIDTLPTLTFLQDVDLVPTLPNSKLITICDHFGVTLDNAHNALADIKATREVYGKMKELLK